MDAEVDEERANLERLLSDSPSAQQQASPSASAAELDESLLVRGVCGCFCTARGGCEAAYVYTHTVQYTLCSMFILYHIAYSWPTAT